MNNRRSLHASWPGGPLTPQFKKEFMAVATSDEIPAADKARFYRGDFRSMDHYKQVKAREANASPQARRDAERFPNQIPDLTPEQIRAAAIHYEPRQTND